MEKINIAELLKECPKGMELDCVLYDDVTFLCVFDDSRYPILIQTPEGTAQLSQYGGLSLTTHAKCIIFPKGKATWKGFVPPCKFKDGDMIFTHTNDSKCNLENYWVSIFKEYRNNRCACYVCVCLSDLELYHDKWEDELLCELCEIEENRPATEEEKAKLFQAIKDNGYKWNAETKTLEELIELKFKVGDRVKHKTRISHGDVVTEIKDTHYILNDDLALPFTFQDEYELVPNKFDISALKPFDKVLVRGDVGQKWTHDFFGFMDKDKGCPFVCVGHYVIQCIPFEGNEHLLGKTDDCSNFYRTWE